MTDPSRTCLPRNSKQIDALRVERRTEFRSDVVPGLILRVGETGHKSWSFSYRRPGTGKRTKVSLGRYPELGLKDAEKRARELRTKVDQGIDPKAHELADHTVRTVRDLADRYLEQHAMPNKRSWRADQRIIGKDILPVIGDFVADTLTQADINAVLDRVERRGAKIQTNKVYELLRGMLRWGVSRAYIQNNPTREMKRRHRPEPGDRALEPDEIVRLWKGLDDTGLSTAMICALRLALVTGQRIGEVCGAERTELNLARGYWEIPAARSKNGRATRVPLSDLAKQLFEEAALHHAGKEFLFASRPRARLGIEKPREQALKAHSAAKAINRKRRHLGFEDRPFTPHDFRRTMATHLQRNGVREEVVARLLNHISETEKTVTRRVYMRHDYEEERRDAMDLWGRMIEKWLSGDGADVVTPFPASGKTAPSDETA
ncbi:hypothetical protein DDZ18_10515 [Marinicauda salina]|uniref:Tyr recombinase domain-containing protein n=1 Tax=Marinicauda salina TaxID=2135793 RepID=A0A2U2BSY3_9PROT|nr:site-specific integrase [Marinicauda salina]PWE17123.1 hypothetical protein DDZ18_10515 [Marinicauda salina]